jgi:hypothetical protein
VCTNSTNNSKPKVWIEEETINTLKIKAIKKKAWRQSPQFFEQVLEIHLG